MYGLAAFLERCLDQLGVERHNLVVHDWGGLALIGAQRRPERLERLVVIDAVPLLPGYRWHWIAQLWRRRPLGEFLNATTTRSSLALLLRQARGDRSAMPPEFVEMIWKHWDKGTRTATLELYRDADPGRLAHAGADLGELACSSLVLWGDRDPYLPTRFADAYAGGPRKCRAPDRSPAPATGPGSTTPRRSIGCSPSSAARALSRVNARITIERSVSRAFASVTARLPKGWGDLGRQIADPRRRRHRLRGRRGIADSKRPDAIAHGQQVIDFEQATHSLFEPGLQEFFLPASWVIDIANQLYLNAQFSIALGFLVWLYLFRNESYYFVRNMFVVSMGLAADRLHRSSRPRRRGCSPRTASSTRSTTSPASTTTRPWPRSSSTPTRRCRACTAPSR